MALHARVRAMSRLLIIYHSRTGGAEAMARAAFEAASEECDAQLLGAGDAQPADLLAAQGVIFCCPENLAAITGEMKEFFDRSYYPLLGRIEGRAYSLMVCAGSDGENAVRQMSRIATGLRLRQVQEPIIVNTNAQTPEAILAPKSLSKDQLAPCRDLGAAFGAGLAMGVF